MVTLNQMNKRPVEKSKDYMYNCGFIKVTNKSTGQEVKQEYGAGC